MIVSAFYVIAAAALGFITTFLSPFKDSNGFPDGVSDAVTLASTYMAKANSFISIAAVYNLLTFIVFYEFVIIMFYILRWIFNFAPFIKAK
jgi:hypothetical protein